MSRGIALSTSQGYFAMVTSQTWMFISSFEKLRKQLLESAAILTLCDTKSTGLHADNFTANAAFSIYNEKLEDYEGLYFKLNQPIEQKPERLLEALANPECEWFYRADASGFEAIPGSPIAYWASDATVKAFSNPPLGSATETHLGMATCDNEKFLRLWYEVSSNKRAQPSCYPYAGDRVWFPYNKGGLFRKWYGNDEYLVNWENDGITLKQTRAVTVDDCLNFKQMISWSRVSSGVLAVRYKPEGFLFDMTGPAAFGDTKELSISLALLNSSTGRHVASFLSATIDFQPGQIAKYPLSRKLNDIPEIQEYAHSNITISKQDWDSFETSWDFKRHPLL